MSENTAARDGFLKRTVRWIGHEFIELLPAICYFFVAFTILAINEQLVLGKLELDLSQLLRPLIGALLVSKILLVANMIPLINSFGGRPLVWCTAWKTFIYWVLGVLFQMAETAIGLLIDGKSVEASINGVFEEAISSQFILVQMWLIILLAIFVALEQLVEAVGPRKVRAMFFGPSHEEHETR